MKFRSFHSILVASRPFIFIFLLISTALCITTRAIALTPPTKQNLSASPEVVPSSNTQSQSPLTVVCSFFIIQNLIQELAPDIFQTETLISANMDPHEFEPRPQSLIALNNAKIIFKVGSGFEPWFDKLSKQAGSKTKIISVTENLKDPHFWLSFEELKKSLSVITSALIELRPDKKDDIQLRSQKYLTQIEFLFKKYTLKKESSPKCTLVTPHNGFSYLSHFFNLDYYPLSLIPLPQEPSVKNLNAKLTYLTPLPCVIFFEEAFHSSSLFKTILAALKKPSNGKLYGDEFPAGKTPTVLEILQYNLETIHHTLINLKDQPKK